MPIVVVGKIDEEQEMEVTGGAAETNAMNELADDLISPVPVKNANAPCTKEFRVRPPVNCKKMLKVPRV